MWIWCWAWFKVGKVTLLLVIFIHLKNKKKIKNGYTSSGFHLLLFNLYIIQIFYTGLITISKTLSLSPPLFPFRSSLTLISVFATPLGWQNARILIRSVLPWRAVEAPTIEPFSVPFSFLFHFPSAFLIFIFSLSLIYLLRSKFCL